MKQFNKPILKQDKAATSEFTITTTREFLNALKKPNPAVFRYQAQRKQLMAGGLSGKELKSAAFTKSLIPCVAFSGVPVQGGSRKTSDYDPQSSTGILLIDVDDLDELDDVKRVRRIVEGLPSCLFSFYSPSGNGIKAGFNVGEVKSDEEFKDFFYKFEYYFKSEHGIIIDPSCKDIFRLCFLSYDPRYYENEDAEIAELEDVPDNNCFAPVTNSKPEAHSGANKNYPKLTSDEIISMLKHVPHTDYDRWLQVGMGLKEWNQTQGLPIWDSWSTQDCELWKDGECARKWKTFSRHSITIATVRDIAQKNGWVKEQNLSEDDEIVNEINKKHAIVVMGNKVVISQEDENGGYSFLSEQAFSLLTRNKYKTVVNGEGKPKLITHSSIWLASPNRRLYKGGIGFAPEQDIGEDKLNMWTGFSYERIPYDLKIIKPFIDYINGLAADKEEQTYLMGWIARGFQKPHLPAEVAIVLRGDKGVGKGTLGKILCRLWGERHSITITSTQHLTGNFNAHLSNLAFMVADEAIYHGDKKGEAVLKSLITEPTMVIERKGFDVIQNKNCMKLIINANDEWVIPSSRDERRFFCLHIVDKHNTKIAKEKLFNHVYRLYDNARTMGMFLDYLLSYNLTGFNHRVYPETVENNSQRALSMGVIPRYLIDICNRGAAQVHVISSYDVSNGVTPMRWHKRVSTDLLMTGLISWGKDNFKNGWEKPTKKQLISYLKELGLNSQSVRGVAKRWTGTETEIINKTSKGWDIGSPEELHGRVCEYQNVMGAIDFDGNTETIPELKTVDEWHEVDEL